MEFSDIEIHFNIDQLANLHFVSARVLHSQRNTDGDNNEFIQNTKDHMVHEYTYCKNKYTNTHSRTIDGTCQQLLLHDMKRVIINHHRLCMLSVFPLIIYPNIYISTSLMQKHENSI